MAEKQDMQAANETYTKFLFWFKWGTIISAVTTVIVVLIIAR